MTGFSTNVPTSAWVTPDGRLTREAYRFLVMIQEMIGGPSNPFDDAILSPPLPSFAPAPTPDFLTPDASPMVASAVEALGVGLLPPSSRPFVDEAAPILPPAPMPGVNYDTGLFTPTVIGSSSGSAATSTASGRFTRIGRLVHVQLRVQVSSAAGPVGNIWIGGLPYAAASGYGRMAAIPVAVDNLTGQTIATLQGSFVNGATIIPADALGAQIAVGALTATTLFDFSADYEI